MKYAFWNNKGGTGKTSLAFQSITLYAENHPDKKVLAVDICPQANLSELMLGGLNNHGSDLLLQRQGLTPRCSLGGYFQNRLPAPYHPPSFNTADYITTPHHYNNHIPQNIDLICGDPLLELQSNAVNTLANNSIPGTNTWIAVIDWMNDFFNKTTTNYGTVFFDCNPSFSMYTQIALASIDRLILPVMADDSSRRALQNAFSLIFGLRLPSEIYEKYMFAHKLREAERSLPQVHLVVKNRITQYMGSASAYAAVLNSIDQEIKNLQTHPEMFTFKTVDQGSVEIRDFQTTGVVAFAKGMPFSQVEAKKQSVGGHRVQVRLDYLESCRLAMQTLVDKLD